MEISPKKKLQLTKIENETRSFDQKTNKRKLLKESNADKNDASANMFNALDDGDTREDTAFDRPKKKSGRKKLKNRLRKLQQRSDGFFCGAPSKCFELSSVKIRNSEN